MDFLYQLPTWLITLTLFLLQILFLRLGIRVGAWERRHRPERDQSSYQTLVGAILGLLGLILGFTYSMTAQRYDQRRLLLVQEVNAIGTSYLRADLLQEPQATQSRLLHQDFVRVRLEQHDLPFPSPEIHQKQAELERVQGAIWELAAKSARQHADPAHALVVDAANRLIDMAGERTASYRAHVSGHIFLLLFILVLISAYMVGYSSGIGASMNIYTQCIFALLVAMVIFTVLDLDRPRRGLIQVSQEPMIELLQSMKNRDAR